MVIGMQETLAVPALSPDTLHTCGDTTNTGTLPPVPRGAEAEGPVSPEEGRPDTHVDAEPRHIKTSLQIITQPTWHTHAHMHTHV